MNYSENYFLFYSTCFLVKGHKRGLIIDTQRENYITIPDTMCEIIDLFKSKKSIEEIVLIYGEDNKEIIDEYITFLIENEFGMFVDFDEFDCFPNMDTSFEIASKITNAIVEISNITLNHFDKIIQNLEDFNCKDAQFISYDLIDIEDLKKILIHTENTNFKSVQLILKYSDEIFDFISKMSNYNQRITELILHTAKDKNKDFENEIDFVYFIEYEIKNFNFCGVVDAKYFGYVNKLRILESLNHNSCLYKKIAVNQNGDIKNCPALGESFGNVKELSLKEAIKQKGFEKFWDIKKDEIETCKDCEFRHICTDCRAFIEEPKNNYSKPLKCGYNPYTNVWEDWSENSLKKEAIDYYNLSQLSDNNK